MTEYGNRLNMEQKQVESSLKNAMDKGDTDAAVAAQRKLSQLAVSADRYTNVQNNRKQEQAATTGTATATTTGNHRNRQPNNLPILKPKNGRVKTTGLEKMRL